MHEPRRFSAFLSNISLYAIVGVVVFVVGAVYILYGVMPVPSAAASVTWDGGGVDDDWCTQDNWSGNALPTDADDVTIDATVTVDTTGCANGDIDFSTLTIGGSNTADLQLTPNLGTVGDITIANNGTFTQLNSTTQSITGTLLIENGGTLTHGDNSTSYDYSVDISAATITIDLGGTVTVDALGFDEYSNNGLLGNGYGPGGGIHDTTTSDWRGTGASHGGTGGFSSDISQNAQPYCDLDNPTTIGSGGAGYYESGDGGGHISLAASGTFTLNGSLSADGENGQSSYGSGGAGGGINLTAATFAGLPSIITANGGNGLSNSGGGGGGCVYLGYTGTSSFNPSSSSYEAYGGTGYEYGGAGAILHKKSTENGSIYVKNNATLGEIYEELDTDITYDLIYVSDAGIYHVTSTVDVTVATTSPFQGDATGYIELYGTLAHTSGNFSRIDGITIQAYSGSDYANGGTVDIYSGGLDLRSGSTATTTFTTLNSSGTIDIYNGATVTIEDVTLNDGTMTLYNYTTGTALTLDALVINSGATLTHQENDTAQTHVINIKANNITVNSGGSVDVDGKGYAGVTNTGAGSGNGPGAGSKGSGGNYGGSGGSHAGAGGGSTYADDPIGATYCVTSSPDTIGSTGVGYYGAGDGGGLIIFDVTSTIDIDGTITADGTEDTEGTTAYSPGGAGGGITISADSITGEPSSFTVAGGDGTGVNYGTGGGGCIALVYSTTNTIQLADVDITGGQTGFEAGGDGSFVASVQTPSAPTTLYAHSSDASSGDANPANLTSLTPVLSALCNTDDGQCITAEIEVDNNSDFSSPIWDSGSIDIVDTNNGVRIADITYAGGQLNYDTTYYWRIRFANSNGNGAWSSNATFSAPRSLELYSFNNGGAAQQGSTQNILWASTGGETNEEIKIEYSTDNFAVDINEITAAASSTASSTAIQSYSWTIPAISSANVKLRLSSNNDGNVYSITSEEAFTIQAGAVASTNTIKFGRTYGESDFYIKESGLSHASGNIQLNGPATWFNTSWDKRKLITVTNNVASEFTNLQVQFDVTYDADMQSDFDDLRFTTESATTTLDYWIEGYTTSTSATVWVEVPSLGSSATTGVYMYYDNDGASSAENISNTFLFGDDFSGGSLDSQWTETNGSPSVSNGLLVLDTDGEGVWAGNYEFGYDEVIEARVRRTETASIDGRLQVSNEDSRFESNILAADRAMAVWHYFSGNQVYAEHSGGTRGYQLFTSANTSWHRYGIYWEDASNADFYYDANTLQRAGATSIPDESDSLHPELYALYDGMDVDWVYVRQYIATDPSESYGSEQALSEVSVDPQSVVWKVGHQFTSVQSFSLTSSTSGNGSITFQVTNDVNTSTWYYCNAGSITEATLGSTHSSAAEDMTNACLSGLSAGTFNVRAYLDGDGGDTVVLNHLSVAIDNNNTSSISISNPSQISSSGVRFQSTVTDVDADLTTAYVEHSTDGTNWASSSFANVIASTGTVSTVTGTISSIDTNVTSSVTVTVDWSVGNDLPNTDDLSVYLRVRSYDGSTYSSWATSSAFAVDTAQPTQPGDLVAYTTATSSIRVQFPTTTSSDNSFSEYRIHYDVESGVTTGDSAFTSSTDDALGSSGFTGATYSDPITGLTPNTLYYLNLFAYDTWGNVTSSANEISTTTLPNAPLAASASASSTTSMTVTWGTNANADGTVYQVYNVTSSTLVGTTTLTTYEATGLDANTSYQFSVRAIGANRANTFSAYATSSAAYTLASAVDNLSVTNTTNTTTLQLQLTWDNAGQTGMLLDRDNSCDGSYDVTLYTSTSTNLSSPTTTSSNLSANTCYRFRVRSYNADASINNITSSSVSITTPPGQVTNVTVDDQATTSIDWSWDAVAGAVGYRIYNNLTAGLIDTAIGVTTYTQTGLVANTVYEVIIRAYNANGTGIASNSASGTTNADIPSGLSVTARTVSTLTFGWTDDGEAAFEVRDQNSILNTSGETTSTSWVYNSLNTNTAYTAEIRAKSDGGVWSSFGSAITRYTAQAAPTGVTTTVQSTSSVQVTVQGSFPNNGVGSSKININNGAGTSQDLTNTTTWTNTGLTPNTQYTYTAYATNGDDVQTATANDSTYTFAAVPGAAVVTIGEDATSLVVTLDENNNPDSTDYLLYVTTTGQYVDEVDLDLSGDSSSYDSLSDWDDPTVTGLSPNTCYQFVQIARNGDSIVTASSTPSASVCTRANVPVNGTATANGTTQIQVSWEANGNSTGTEYYAEDASDSATNSGWTSSTTYLFTGLTAGQDYTFKVKARNTDEVETNYLGSISIAGGDNAEEDNAAALPGAFAPPIVGDLIEEIINDEEDNNVSATTTIQEVKPNLSDRHIIVSSTMRESADFVLSGEADRLMVRNANNDSIIVRFDSEPVATLLFLDIPKDIDEDGDGEADKRVIYRGQEDDRYIIEIIDLYDERELSVMGITINAGAFDTEERDVSITLHAHNAVSYAISRTRNFELAEFVPYTSTTEWRLTDEQVEQYAYVRFRGANGATADSSDSIVYIGPREGACELDTNVPYRVDGTDSIYLLTQNDAGACEKRFFQNEEVYYSYFESFDSVVILPSSTNPFIAIPNHEYPALPYGPLHELRNGDVVKLLTNPKVYLIASAHRHWILTGAVYRALVSYFNTPIKPVTEELLDQYPERQPVQTQADVERILPYQFQEDLNVGDEGEEVSRLQEILIDGGYAGFDAPTAFYGQQTAAAVRAYQAAVDVPVTGVLDEDTRYVLNNRENEGVE